MAHAGETFRLPALATCIVLLMQVIGAIALPAQQVDRENPGFESPPLTAASSWYPGAQGWGIVGAIGTTYALPQLPSSPAPQGQQYAYANTGSFHLFQARGVTQPDTMYTCEIDVFPLSATSTSLELVIEESETFSVVMAQKVYRPSWDAAREDFSLPAGAWTRVVLQFNSSQFLSAQGKQQRFRISGAYAAIDNATFFAWGPRAARSFYISESSGNDLADAMTPATAWKSFTNLGRILMQPGDQIQLRRGDTWTEAPLRLWGSGTSVSPITLGAWGEGRRPIIDPNDKETALCIVIENGSHWRIRDMEARRGKIGLYLRYIDDYGNSDMVIERCHFENFDSWTADPTLFNYEFAFNAGIFIGGRVYDPNQAATVLNGLTIQDCGFANCTSGINTNWFWPQLIRNRVRQVSVSDCWATRVSSGALVWASVSDSLVRRFRVFERCGRTGDFVWGSIGAFIYSCANLTIEDSEFSETDRMWHDDQAGDGGGIDIDGNCDNIVLRESVIHSNEGPGQLFLSTLGAVNTGVRLENTTTYNNGLDAAVSYGGNAYEIKVGNGTVSGAQFINLGLYRSAPSWGWTYPATPSAGTFSETNVRKLTAAAVLSRPNDWSFGVAGDFLNWGSFSSDWLSPVVAGGELRGTCGSGVDPFVLSAPTWIDTNRNETIRITMRSSTAETAVLFFCTDTDPTWSIDKAVAIPLAGDNASFTHIVHLQDHAKWSGVVTQLRLDPSSVPGTQFGISNVVVESNPHVVGIDGLEANAMTITFNEPMRFGVHDPANYVLSGAGRGTLAANPSSITQLGPRQYRLAWISGSMVSGQAIALHVSGPSDIYGNALSPTSLVASAVPVELEYFSVD